jgi:hypothetical protein
MYRGRRWDKEIEENDHERRTKGRGREGEDAKATHTIST